MPFLRRRSSTPPAATNAEAVVQALPAEEEPLLYTLRIALNLLIREASAGDPPTKAGPLCDAIEAVLAHGFKSRQFFVFSVHPWSLLELGEKTLPGLAESVKLARSAGKSDGSRLRSWLEIQLNRGTLCTQLESLCADTALVTTMYAPEALVCRDESRGLLIDTLRPVESLSFHLGDPPGIGLGSGLRITSSAASTASTTTVEEVIEEDLDAEAATEAPAATETEARMRALEQELERTRTMQAEAEQQRQLLAAQLAKKVADHEATSSRLVELEAQVSGRRGDEDEDQSYEPFGSNADAGGAGFEDGVDEPTYEPFGGSGMDDFSDDGPRTPVKVVEPVGEEMVQERWTF